jgi:lantibiotic modifying enzyme
MKKTETVITDSFSEVALSAGLRLVRDAIWHDDKCNWIGANVAPVGGRYQVVRNACPPGIYSGLAGIALFLGHLSETDNEPLVDITLNGAVNAIIDNSASAQLPVYSWFNGSVGVADALISLGERKKKKKWVKAGSQLLESVRDTQPKPEEIDVIGGVAGVIPVLLRHYRQKKEQWLLDTAIQCGELLLQSAVHQGNECTWITMPGSPGLTGYSHGNSGVSLALMELYGATGQHYYLQTAMAGIQFERNRFNPAQQNWPDLRQMPGSTSKPGTCAEAWCHGAPGMVLPRIRAWQITGDKTLLDEAHLAINTTRNGLLASNSNYSLCHGVAGNADILLTAGIVLNDQSLTQRAAEAGRFGIERVVNYNMNWPGGVSDPMGSNTQYDNPSLMLGLAGTAYFYLRLANPHKVPSLMLVN